VTLASNQQIIPALQPQSSTPFSQAPRRIVSNPWTRHTASAFAVFPPETYTTSWASTTSRKFVGGHGLNETCVGSARGPNDS
jgi:hypothetical protein